MPFLEPAELKRRLDRHAAFFRGELTEGPLVKLSSMSFGYGITQASQGHEPPPADDPEALRRWWTDPALVIPRVEQALAAAQYFEDAYPHHFVNLGPGVLAGFMGCESVCQVRTVWQEPLIDDWATAPALVLHEDSEMWLAAQDLTRASLEAAGGRWVTSITDIGGAMDVTSYFRTPERMCMDLIEHPDEVLRSEAAVIEAWFQVYDRLAALVMPQSGGTCGWMCMWYPGRTYPLQCDFSCMISPAMFREFAMPFLQEQAAGLDNAVYHLDGPGAIRHLEMICEIPNIRAIQWVPGAGHSAAVADWLDLYRRIQDLGRGIVMGYERPEELDLVFQHLDPDRVCIPMHAATPEELDAIRSRLDRLRAGRKRVQ